MGIAACVGAVEYQYSSHDYEPVSCRSVSIIDRGLPARKVDVQAYNIFVQKVGVQAYHIFVQHGRYTQSSCPGAWGRSSSPPWRNCELNVLNLCVKLVYTLFPSPHRQEYTSGCIGFGTSRGRLLRLPVLLIPVWFVHLSLHTEFVCFAHSPSTIELR